MIAVLAPLFLFATAFTLHAVPGEDSPIALAIHGGAGTITKDKMTPEAEAAYRAKLKEALMAGYEALKSGGRGLDAVEAVIVILEDSPLFNAGKGAVFTSDGTNEMDASVMDGATLQAGAVSGVKHIKHPVRLARLVLDKSPHVMLVGAGAEDFAARNGMERVSGYYFHTERRWKSLVRAKQKEAERASQLPAGGAKKPVAGKERGTVGAVALDRHGNLAAGTSTGGLTNKMFGRVGDSPIIGAGTYANNETCAVSCTGDGEYFMRLLVAHEVSALMNYAHKSLKQAAEEVIMKKLTELGGGGGLIAIDASGNIAMPFNTEGMYRGYVDKGGKAIIKIYKDE